MQLTTALSIAAHLLLAVTDIPLRNPLLNERSTYKASHEPDWYLLVQPRGSVHVITSNRSEIPPVKSSCGEDCLFTHKSWDFELIPLSSSAPKYQQAALKPGSERRDTGSHAIAVELPSAGKIHVSFVRGRQRV